MTLRGVIRISVPGFSLGLLLGCPPATVRPPFRPFPNALNAELGAVPAVVIQEARDRLTAEGASVAWYSQVDGYVESRWFNVITRQAGEWEGANPEPWVKVRIWADPGPPGKTLLTLEVAYRPLDDPSRYERDLELIVPPGHGGYELGQRVLRGLKEKFRSPAP